MAIEIEYLFNAGRVAAIELAVECGRAERAENEGEADAAQKDEIYERYPSIRNVIKDNRKTKRDKKTPNKSKK